MSNAEFGPITGKYDHLAKLVRDGADAKAVFVIVVEGDKGSGFSIIAPPQVVLDMPAILRDIADGADKVMNSHPGGPMGYLLQLVQEGKCATSQANK